MVVKQSTCIDVEKFCNVILSCCCCYDDEDSLQIHKNTGIVWNDNNFITVH